MLKVELEHAVPGMVLALPVMHPELPGHTLLHAGYELEAEVMPRLHRLRIRRLWVGYPALDFVDKYISREVMQGQAQMVNTITDAFTNMQRKATARINYDAYCRNIGNLVSRLLNSPQAALFLDDLSSTEPEGLDLVRHASTVTYLSLLMGLKMEGYLVKQRKHIDPGRAKEVVNLGVGAMLHDIGIRELTPEVRNRYMITHDETDPAWREHPTLGYHMVRQNVEPSVATVVLNHHQRWDGSGYAGSAVPVLAENRIHVFARIAGLADQFDRMRQMHRETPVPVVAVLRELLKPEYHKQFDPQAMITLFAVVPPYAPGSIVKLSDGRFAVVLEPHPADPCRPVVQPIHDPQKLDEGLAGEPLDLSQEGRNYMIVECDGENVERYHFAAPSFMEDFERSFKVW